jgi:hypothetical protein
MLGHMLLCPAAHAGGKKQVHARRPQESRPLARLRGLRHDQYSAMDDPPGRINLHDNKLGRGTVVRRKFIGSCQR